MHELKLPRHKKLSSTEVKWLTDRYQSSLCSMKVWQPQFWHFDSAVEYCLDFEQDGIGK